jgi:hypothetical protein
MFSRLLKLLSVLLFGWFVFVFGAIAYAKLFGRASTQPDPDADELDLVATFGPLEYKGTSKAFRGGAVTTWFGGGGVDLTDVTLAPGGATLRVQALFGGGNLVVPEDWRVETRVLGIGGVGDGRPRGNPAPGAPTLRLEGYAIFGGWGITPAPANGDAAARADAAAAEDAAGA